MRILTVMLLIAGVLFCGCQPAGAPLVDVNGQVTCEGKPVTEGMVTFMSKQTGSAASTKLDQEGKFHFEVQLNPEKYVVTIIPPPSEEVAGAPTSTPVKKYPNIPQKYRSDVTSPLEALVTDGDNNFEFELDSTKP